MQDIKISNLDWYLKNLSIYCKFKDNWLIHNTDISQTVKSYSHDKFFFLTGLDVRITSEQVCSLASWCVFQILFLYLNTFTYHISITCFTIVLFFCPLHVWQESSQQELYWRCGKWLHKYKNKISNQISEQLFLIFYILNTIFWSKIPCPLFLQNFRMFSRVS
jgi:hypothetical protein